MCSLQAREASFVPVQAVLLRKRTPDLSGVGGLAERNPTYGLSPTLSFPTVGRGF